MNLITLSVTTAMTGQAGPVLQLVEGAPANLCVIDTHAPWTVEAAKLMSKSRNTPYAGRTLSSRVRHTVLFGEPVVVDADPQR